MLNHAFDESQRTTDPATPIRRISSLECSSLCWALDSKIYQGCEQLHQESLLLLSLADSLDHPVLLAQRAAIVLFHPQGHAAVVKGMITLSPDHNTILLFVFRLTPKTGIHHLDPADGARIALHVPAPHGHRVPLLEREHFVAPRLGACAPGVG